MIPLQANYVGKKCFVKKSFCIDLQKLYYHLVVCPYIENTNTWYYCVCTLQSHRPVSGRQSAKGHRSPGPSDYNPNAVAEDVHVMEFQGGFKAKPGYLKNYARKKWLWYCFREWFHDFSSTHCSSCVTQGLCMCLYRKVTCTLAHI